MKKFLISTLMILSTVLGGTAQVTTSTLTGIIRDVNETLIGATVRATHTPTGTAYAASSGPDGRFTISNMRVGGPYTIEVTYIGYEPRRFSDVTLQLGEPYILNVTLAVSGTQLSEVVISGTVDPILNRERTGAATNVNRQQLENLPTISRSLQDFTRLTPQATGTNSFGGANNRFNNVTIDGAVNNDVFGLSGSGTPGGQAGTQPISLDAIQEIQVVLAPYDITQGNFTGGGVNAVTRSGTNKFQGSAYYFGRTEDIVGENPLSGVSYPSFKEDQYGFRLGGPILKNKLFFFVNAELGRRAAPIAFNAGDPGAPTTLATAQQIRDFTLQTYGYDVGGFGAVDARTENDKVFAKLDWNINNKHQLTVRHNYINAFDDNISRTGSSFRFGNNAYQFNDEQHVSVVELRSNFSSLFSNNLILGYSRIRDDRETAGALFPQVQINNVDQSGNSVFFGSERSSTANELDQDIFEITNNFKYYRGNHTFTIGTHNEFFKFRNLFINNLNGRWDFNSLQDYLNNAPARARITYSALPGVERPDARFNAAQLAFYAQDQFDLLEKLNLTVGVRVDIPIIGDKPLANPAVEASFPGVRTDRTPSGQVLFAPRLGFNYDVLGDRSVQIRGGAGVFTGRVPFVWLSNQFVNNGLLFNTIDVRGAAINNGNGFEPNVALQRNVGGAGSTAEINVADEDFRIPQVARFNLAGDFRLPFGFVGTLEGIYSKTINNIAYRDINLLPASGSISPAYSNGADLRPRFNSGPTGVVNPAFTNVIFLDNTDKGYTYSLTAQLQRNFNFGLSASVAYTNGKSKDVNSGASSTALSNWEFVQIVNDPNDPPLSYSNYDIRHRIVGSLAYRKAYGKDNAFATGVSLFYAGRSGFPFTYLYAGDLNGDGRFSNDLFYVPRSAAEINLVPTASNPRPVAEQWESLNAFIENDPYLRERRGQYTERNGARTPWEHQFDLRISQDLGVNVRGARNTLQFTFDIFNVGNLLNKDWGRAYSVNNNAVELVSVTGTGFNFNRSNPEGYNISDLGSRWQGQFGIRYIFD